MKEHILVVEDDASVRKLLESWLKGSGYPVSTAPTAEDALAVVQRGGVDLVLTDIVLPGMNGLGLLRRIKSEHDVDVIVMTGFVDDHDYVEAIQKGACDFILKPLRMDELALRVRRALMERHLRTSNALLLRDLRSLVISDQLTGLYNSKHFQDQLRVEMGRARRYHHALGLLLFDVDHFKECNDTHGHLAGDDVLRRVAQLLRSSLRTVDSAYRYGGEEFAAILPENGAQAAMGVAERIRATVEQTAFQADTETTVHVTISVGVTEYREPEELTAFVRRADEAMYLSKRKSRNAVSGLMPDGTEVPLPKRG